MADIDPRDGAPVLSRDSSAEIERLQVQIWRRMSPLDKAEIVSQATADVLALAALGIRQRHPSASERECFIRLAALQLGPMLACRVYPDAFEILGSEM